MKITDWAGVHKAYCALRKRNIWALWAFGGSVSFDILQDAVSAYIKESGVPQDTVYIRHANLNDPTPAVAHFHILSTAQQWPCEDATVYESFYSQLETQP